MRTLPRRATRLLIVVAFVGCVNNTNTTRSTSHKPPVALKTASNTKTAPDIVGIDADGEKFRLSDYRGKVVLLDFWARY